MSKSANADTLTIAERWLDEGKSVALATVVDTWSSAPLPIGSQMVIDADGAVHGSISGGCVESQVIADAIETLQSGQAKLLEFGVTDDAARGVGLACGGRMTIYLERIS